MPTSANLNYYGSSGSCVRWHCDDEALLGGQGESKLIVSMSVGFSARFRWKPGPSPDCEADSCWLHHGDLLVMDGRCQDEYLHSTDPRLQAGRVNITFRWIKDHLPQCLVGAGVVCCLPTCVGGSSVSTSAGMAWPVWDFWGVPFGPAGVGIAGTCDPHVGVTLATEGRCALVESLVARSGTCIFFVVLLGGSLGPVLATGVFGVSGEECMKCHVRKLKLNGPVHLAMTRIWYEKPAGH